MPLVVARPIPRLSFAAFPSETDFFYTVRAVKITSHVTGSRICQVSGDPGSVRHRPRALSCRFCPKPSMMTTAGNAVSSSS